jgi:hypothetical protein
LVSSGHSSSLCSRACSKPRTWSISSAVVWNGQKQNNKEKKKRKRKRSSELTAHSFGVRILNNLSLHQRSRFGWCEKEPEIAAVSILGIVVRSVSVLKIDEPPRKCFCELFKQRREKGVNNNTKKKKKKWRKFSYFLATSQHHFKNRSSITSRPWT